MGIQVGIWSGNMTLMVIQIEILVGVGILVGAFTCIVVAIAQ